MSFNDSVDAMMTKNPNWAASTGMEGSRKIGHRRNPKVNTTDLWRKSLNGAFGNIETPEWKVMLITKRTRRKPNMLTTRRRKSLPRQLQP